MGNEHTVDINCTPILPAQSLYVVLTTITRASTPLRIQECAPEQAISYSERDTQTHSQGVALFEGRIVTLMVDSDVAQAHSTLLPNLRYAEAHEERFRDAIQAKEMPLSVTRTAPRISGRSSLK